MSLMSLMFSLLSFELNSRSFRETIGPDEGMQPVHTIAFRRSFAIIKQRYYKTLFL